MPASKKWMLVTILLVGGLTAIMVPQVLGVQDIREDRILAGTLKANLDRIKTLYRYAGDMQREADPFLNPHHQARYRFSPSEHYGREMMNFSRKMHLDFTLLKGILSDAQVVDRDLILKALLDGADSLGVFGKRALRARRDGNFALYIASAQAAEKEIKDMDVSLLTLEKNINASIREADAKLEDL